MKRLILLTCMLILLSVIAYADIEDTHGWSTPTSGGGSNSHGLIIQAQFPIIFKSAKLDSGVTGQCYLVDYANSSLIENVTPVSRICDFNDIFLDTGERVLITAGNVGGSYTYKRGTGQSYPKSSTNIIWTNAGSWDGSSITEYSSDVRNFYSVNSTETYLFYNFTFTNASNEGFSEFTNCDGNPLYSSDDFRSSTSDKAVAIMQQLNLRPDVNALNISFDYVAGSTSYLIVGLTNQNTTGGCGYYNVAFAIEEQGTKRTWSIINNVNQYDYELGGGDTHTYNMITYPYGDFELYRDGVRVHRNIELSDMPDYSNLVMHVRRPNDAIDNVLIQSFNYTEPYFDLHTSFVNNTASSSQGLFITYNATSISGDTTANCVLYDGTDEVMAQTDVDLTQNNVMEFRFNCGVSKDYHLKLQCDNGYVGEDGVYTYSYDGRLTEYCYYNYTFEGGISHGFSELGTCDGNPRYSDDRFESDTSDKMVAIYKDLNLNPAINIVNVSFEYVAGSSNYIRVGLTDVNTTGGCSDTQVGFYIEEQSPKRTQSVVNNAHLGDFQSTGGDTYTYNFVTYPDGNFELYRNGVLANSNFTTMDADWGKLVLYLRKPSDSIDTVFVQETYVNVPSIAYYENFDSYKTGECPDNWLCNLLYVDTGSLRKNYSVDGLANTSVNADIKYMEYNYITTSWGFSSRSDVVLTEDGTLSNDYVMAGFLWHAGSQDFVVATPSGGETTVDDPAQISHWYYVQFYFNDDNTVDIYVDGNLETTDTWSGNYLTYLSFQQRSAYNNIESRLDDVLLCTDLHCLDDTYFALHTDFVNDTQTLDTELLVTYNATNVMGNEIVNCTLYDDGTPVNTDYNVNISQNNVLNFTYGYNQLEQHKFSITCENSEYSDSTGEYTYDTYAGYTYFAGYPVFYDDFDDNSLNTTKWINWGSDTCTETNQKIECWKTSAYRLLSKNLLDDFYFKDDKYWRLNIDVGIGATDHAFQDYWTMYEDLGTNKYTYRDADLTGVVMYGAHQYISGNDLFGFHINPSSTIGFTNNINYNFLHQKLTLLHNQTGYYIIINDDNPFLRYIPLQSTATMTKQIERLYFGRVNNDRQTRMDFDNVSLVYMTPTLVLTTNLVNNTINYGTHNLSIDFEGQLFGVNNSVFNCSLYVDNVLNSTQNNIDLSTTQSFFIDYGNYTTDDFYYRVECENSEASDETIDYFYRVDTIQPTIFETSGFVNQSSFRQVADPNITFNFTLFDLNLYARNGTLIYMGNNTVFFNDFEEGITVDEVNVSYTFDPDDLWVGTWQFREKIWDSHTSPNPVKPIAWYFSDDNLIAEDDIVWEGEFKELDGQGNPATYFYLSPDGTKYKLKMTFYEDSLFHTINISSPSGNLDFRPEDLDGYLGHFVYFPTTRWIDHQGKNIKNVTVTPLGDNKWNLLIEHYNSTDEVEFESIADLNERELGFEFYVLCYEDWQPFFTACNISDNQTLYYLDANECGFYDYLPLDNGTIYTCNYCTVDYGFDEVCVDYELIQYPVYNNFETCCNVTGIEADCWLPDNQTLQSCTGLHSTNEITGLVVDFGAEYGITILGFVGVIALIGIGGWVFGLL